MDPKYILKLTLTLLITCIIVAGILGYVNSITKGKIAEFNATKTQAAMEKVFQDAGTLDAPVPVDITDAMNAAADAYKATLETVNEVQVSGKTVGYAVKIAASGSQGDIEMMVGIDTEGAVTGVSIIKNVETSGIGSRVMSNENGVLDQFAGKTTSDQPLTVGKNVDAISGATVSSKGVTKGVNGALAAVGAMG
jgi:electron transport complex protein RnfG